MPVPGAVAGAQVAVAETEVEAEAETDAARAVAEVEAGGGSGNGSQYPVLAYEFCLDCRQHKYFENERPLGGSNASQRGSVGSAAQSQRSKKNAEKHSIHLGAVAAALPLSLLSPAELLVKICEFVR